MSFYILDMKTLAFFFKKKKFLYKYMEREPLPTAPGPGTEQSRQPPGKAEEPKYPRGVAVLAAPSLCGHFTGGKAQLLQPASWLAHGMRPSHTLTHRCSLARARGAGGILGNGPGQKPCKSPLSGSQRNEAKLIPALCLTFCGCYKRERI